jgi:hypothetical protein
MAPRPPGSSRIAPVMWDAAGESANAAAQPNSSGSPYCATGCAQTGGHASHRDRREGNQVHGPIGGDPDGQQPVERGLAGPSALASVFTTPGPDPGTAHWENGQLRERPVHRGGQHEDGRGGRPGEGAGHLPGWQRMRIRVSAAAGPVTDRCGDRPCTMTGWSHVEPSGGTQGLSGRRPRRRAWERRIGSGG